MAASTRRQRTWTEVSRRGDRIECGPRRQGAQGQAPGRCLAFAQLRGWLGADPEAQHEHNGVHATVVRVLLFGAWHGLMGRSGVQTVLASLLWEDLAEEEDDLVMHAAGQTRWRRARCRSGEGVEDLERLCPGKSFEREPVAFAVDAAQKPGSSARLERNRQRE
ncbi:hypothetical protein VM1G_10818 [Cytospora mali]|uniref:Uncharacterized protein n=1 Tax=Cytospora mali TaxID=578113 RepID=A0A194VIQ8_CYTMA|nr:hypothetical protein VM1G_10818 [Valsa mali]